jgi:hypothetical protein
VVVGERYAHLMGAGDQSLPVSFFVSFCHNLDRFSLAFGFQGFHLSDDYIRTMRACQSQPDGAGAKLDCPKMPPVIASVGGISKQVV